ncbi:MAG: aldehyde ferredoxin oxidoreductase N-terminal domain-containing protein [Caldilineaceae bacterium]
MIGGFTNRVAWIDLSTGDIEYRGVDEADAIKHIGARAPRCKYVFDNGPDVEPFSPDNLLCVMNGPLTGTDVNMSGRLAVVTSLADRDHCRFPHGRLDCGSSSSGPVSTGWSSRARPTSPPTPMWKTAK